MLIPLLQTFHALVMAYFESPARLDILRFFAVVVAAWVLVIFVDNTVLWGLWSTSSLDHFVDLCLGGSSDSQVLTQIFLKHFREWTVKNHDDWASIRFEMR